MVEVPKSDGIIIGDETLNDYQLFSYTVNEGWELLDSKIDVDDKNNYYLYAYNTTLEPSSTSTLFNEVIFANVGSDFHPDQALMIKVTGYANVVVELTEPNWAPDTDSNSDGINDTMSNIVADQTIAKDPTVTNIGDNDAYVYIMVEVPKADGLTIDNTTVNDQQLINYTTNKGWELLDSKIDTDDNYNYYLYAYDNQHQLDMLTVLLHNTPKTLVHRYYTSL